MREHLPVVLKGACVLLGASIVVQAYGLFKERDPLLGLEDSALLQRVAAGAGAEGTSAAAEKGPPPPAAEKKSAPEGEKKAEPPPPDPRQRAIEKSGIFGEAPRKGGPRRPSLLGIAGDRAILKLPDGKVDLVSEGAEASGVKVLRIATNRVLVEFKGKKIELTIFSGLGSDPLSEKSGEREKENKREGNKP